MKHYFFDYVTAAKTLHDFEGRHFATTREASEYAKLLALHLEYAPDAQYTGWWVAVRDSSGKEVDAVHVAPETLTPEGPLPQQRHGGGLSSLACA
jgi:hypothetical protein